ncbi:MAG: hypothetical protein RLZZ74_589 [Cyanobacteriota bacterium]|jgi:hypothetical protein
MGLTEDILRLASLCLRQFERAVNSDGGSCDDQLDWCAQPLYHQGTFRAFSGGNSVEPWLTNQLPNLCEEQ